VPVPSRRRRRDPRLQPMPRVQFSVPRVSPLQTTAAPSPDRRPLPRRRHPRGGRRSSQARSLRWSRTLISLSRGCSSRCQNRTTMNRPYVLLRARDLKSRYAGIIAKSEETLRVLQRQDLETLRLQLPSHVILQYGTSARASCSSHLYKSYLDPLKFPIFVCVCKIWRFVKSSN
jgi:hypothetical protein